MHGLSYRPRRSKGFVLLHTLWLLLAATTLIAGVLVLAMRSSEGLALAEHETRRELAQESAVELVLHDIVAQGERSPWLQLPRVNRELDLDGQAVALSVQNVAGLVDAGTSDIRTLSALLAGTTDSGAVLTRVEAARLRLDAGIRPFATYAELRAIMGISDRAFGCLYPHVTLFSGQSQPEPSFAPPALVALLKLGRRASEQPSAMENAPSAAGSTYRIEALASNAVTDGGGQALSVEVTITGKLQPSYVVRSWLYIPRIDADTPCP